MHSKLICLFTLFVFVLFISPHRIFFSATGRHNEEASRFSNCITPHLKIIERDEKRDFLPTLSWVKMYVRRNTLPFGHSMTRTNWISTTVWLGTSDKIQLTRQCRPYSGSSRLSVRNGFGFRWWFELLQSSLVLLFLNYRCWLNSSYYLFYFFV